MTALPAVTAHERASCASLPCHYCGVSAGHPCVTGDERKPARQPHALRRYALRRARQEARS